RREPRRHARQRAVRHRPRRRAARDDRRALQPRGAARNRDRRRGRCNDRCTDRQRAVAAGAPRRPPAGLRHRHAVLLPFAHRRERDDRDPARDPRAQRRQGGARQHPPRPAPARRHGHLRRTGGLVNHVFPRHPKLAPPVAVGGAGVHLFDQAGKRYLDASGGAAVSCLGHGHPKVVAALKAQVESLAYAHTSFFTSEAAEALADTLIASAPPGMARAYFVSGGSEAVEAALKLARQYFVERGELERRVIISRRQSYHGNTLGALAAGGNEWRKAPYTPLLIDVPLIAPCFA